ncbi:PREDICTED: olfactory receptor 51E1-like [Nanorana parkeri]|uniref:olfactory receptor 51E1-like n=1 Tax=Nanorana parkeri TaxID=125878 RepID=UPI000854AEDD|nr:PREDICTED: olfactory receptor 51E1-like [Nanorana parkeri]
MMSGGNNLSSSHFILIGIPGLEDVLVWISLPVFIMYLITLLANISVLFVIKSEESLHQPMYLFLSMLLFTDLVQSNAAVPNMLLIFWFNLHEISFEGCLVQMFFIHSFSIMGSTILLAMAFDRYVAICQPLRYSAILTYPLITEIGVLVAMGGTLLVFPHPFLVRRLPFCKSHVIDHSYCEHIAVAKLSCADIRVNVVYGLAVAVLVVGVDVAGITVSYAMIINAIFNLSSKEARHKVRSTCVSHVCVILLAYIPALFSFVTQRFGERTASSTQIILSNLYLIVPPMLNPIIYGMKTKEIQRNVLKVLVGDKMSMGDCPGHELEGGGVFSGWYRSR